MKIVVINNELELNEVLKSFDCEDIKQHMDLNDLKDVCVFEDKTWCYATMITDGEVEVSNDIDILTFEEFKLPTYLVEMYHPLAKQGTTKYFQGASEQTIINFYTAMGYKDIKLTEANDVDSGVGFIQLNSNREFFVKYTKNDEGTHTCKYCGSSASGSDENELCDGCKESFGHKYYSEL